MPPMRGQDLQLVLPMFQLRTVGTE